MTNKIIINISKELNVTEKQVKVTLNMLEEGNTIPFIARYRKEVTGGLEEVTINEDELVDYINMNM